MSSRTFVFAACGDAHIPRLNTALRFLKRFTRADVIVVRARGSFPVAHDQVIEPVLDQAHDDHQASIILKTTLHRLLDVRSGLFCYLDTDVIAVSKAVDEVFRCARGPVTFGADHGDLASFSRYAVRCGCGRRCDHLRRAIRQSLGVRIAASSWQHWNGGVFLFGGDSAAFMEQWHAFALRTLADRYWFTRDQGALAAAVWRSHLQNHPKLPACFNYILDAFQGIAIPRRARARIEDLYVDPSLRFDDSAHAANEPNGGRDRRNRPVLLHLINGSVGRRDWKHWDDIARLAPAEPSQASAPQERVARRLATAACQAPELSRDNLVVHGLWVGPELSRLELLTLHSFLRQGHEFHLWLYGGLKTPLPKEVVLEDATQILPRDRVFKKRDVDPETGVGSGSYGAPFADLFRYKLLFERGGWWTDMDVTCLRPLRFRSPYFFRSHRVGVVGNLMKCPRGSRLMYETYERVVRRADENSAWLMPTRILSAGVRRRNLTRYVRSTVCNEDSWWHVIRPFIESAAPIPKRWYAIHWINEFWRTLAAGDGRYRGAQLMQAVPSKDAPGEGTTLWRLYRDHGLLPDPGSTERASAAPAVVASAAFRLPPAPLNRPAVRQPLALEPAGTPHLNVLIPSMARGGAERSVQEVATTLAVGGAKGKILLLHDTRLGYPLADAGGVRVRRLQGRDPEAQLRAAALELLASPVPLVFTHLIKAALLRRLWESGIATIPVIQNAEPSWQDPPAAFDHPRVPFVVAVSEEIARQLRQAGCSKPVVTVRHEVQQWFDVATLHENRRRLRARHGISDDTLLIGMVGEFKSQKAYPRAVRVLAAVRRRCRAKLMILGGWDHQWGYGRATYTATCQQALELGVMADLITPGLLPEAAEYYAAFDVFLNTSVYEGLSVAMLEAVRAGCPIVSADAGGNREALPADAELVTDAANPEAYLQAIERVLCRESRPVPVRPLDADLIPRLWCLLGAYGYAAAFDAEGAGTLFLTDNLNLGGAARSLINLLRHLGAQRTPDRLYLGVLYEVYCEEYLQAVEQAGLPVFSLHGLEDYIAKCETILWMIRRLGVRAVCFWNVDARVKLVLAKVIPRDAVRLIDVSPGDSLFAELHNEAELTRRICLDADQYFARLDHFVTKFAGGGPPRAPARRGKVAVIPNGVPAPSEDSGVAAAPASADGALFSGLDPNLIIGTCSRIMPDKRIDFLVEMMECLTPRLPNAGLVVVGGVDPRHLPYWELLVQKIEAAGLCNIRFAGPHADVMPFLRRFRVFVMIADRHGCPNASLEAMAMGLPVVANAAGGTTEQVRDGVNGFIVSDRDALAMADRVRYILTDDAVQKRLGEAGRRIAREEFSMERMARGYRALLGAGRGARQRQRDLSAIDPPAGEPSGDRSAVRRAPTHEREIAHAAHQGRSAQGS